MRTRQWMVTHEWMVKPMAQTEWIQRRGILVWIAEVFTSLGSGLYLVSLVFNSFWGMLIAWLIIMGLKIPLHIAYFGKPLRFWRTIPPFTDAWKTSWFTRGISFNILFGGFAFIQLILSYWLPGSAWEILFKVLAGIFAFFVGIYGGFIMNYCKSVPFWNSALLPVVFVLAGVADGFALIMAVVMGSGGVPITVIEEASRWLLIFNAFIIGTYLLSATYTSETAKRSVNELIKGGSAAVSFWVGVIALGIIIPIVISVSSYFAGGAASPLLTIAIASHTLGAFGLKYSLLKVGIHRPLVPFAAAY